MLTPASWHFVPGNDMTINGFLLNGKAHGGMHLLPRRAQPGRTPYDITNNPKLVKINGVRQRNGDGQLALPQLPQQVSQQIRFPLCPSL